MRYTLHKMTGLLIGAAIGLACGYGLFVFWIIVGVFTGVLGMCSSASEAWASLYWPLTLLIPTCGAVVVGCWTYRWYLQHHLLKQE